METHCLNLFSGTWELYRMRCLGALGLVTFTWIQGWLRMLSFLSISKEELPLWSEESGPCGTGWARPPVLITCTPGEAHTWTRSRFHFNGGFLSNFKSQMVVYDWCHFGIFTKSSVTGIKWSQVCQNRSGKCRKTCDSEDNVWEASNLPISEAAPSHSLQKPNVQLNTFLHFIMQPLWRPWCSLERRSYFYKGREEKKKRWSNQSWRRTEEYMEVINNKLSVLKI